jgi:hypothetical protein
MSEWNQQQQRQQQQRQPAISFATPPSSHRTDSARGPFADPPPSQGSHPYLGAPNSEYPASSSTLHVQEFGDHAGQYEEEAQPLTHGAPGGFNGGFYPPPG